MRRHEIVIKGGPITTIKNRRSGKNWDHGIRDELGLQQIAEVFKRSFCRNFPTATMKCSQGLSSRGGKLFLRVEILYPT